MRAEGPPAPRRPLVWLAAALGSGSWLGFESSSVVAAGASAAGVGLALALALTLIAHRLGRTWVPPWAVWALALAWARANAMADPPAAHLGRSAVELGSLRDQPIVGRWRPWSGGPLGRIEAFDGQQATLGHALVLEPECAPPAEGSPVVVLPGGEVRHFARGPRLPARSRAHTFAASSVVAPDELERLGSGHRPSWTAWSEPLARGLAGLRARVGRRVAELEGFHSAGLLRALATGERDGLDPRRVDLFARTGTSHLLAISGWHVSLFAAWVLLPLSRFARHERTTLGLILQGIVLFLFAALAGAGKPVLRATAALLLHRLTTLRGRPRLRRPDALSFLSAAFAFECLVDPLGIRSLSLTLSYGATLGLVLGAGHMASLPATSTRDMALAPNPLARWVGLLSARARVGLRKGVAGSAAAVLITLPLVWSTFGEIAPAGVLLTLGAILPFGCLSLVAWFGALVPWSGWSVPAELGARLLYAWLEFGDRLPGTPLLLPPRPLPLLVLATALVFVGLRRPWARRPASFLWGLLLLPWCAAPTGLELHALDVGHGSAMVLRAPGLEALVYDAGSRDRTAIAREAVLPLLASWDVSGVEVALSHPHVDHTSGLPRLIERVPLRRWLGAWPAQHLVRMPHGVERMDLCSGRMEWTGLCPDLRFALLRGHPVLGNEGSRALELSWRGQRLLFLGDSEREGLDGLDISSGPLRLLLAPHHGSDAQALGRLLDRCPPEEVWISASGAPAVGGELDRRELPWRWTGRDGPLALHLP